VACTTGVVRSRSVYAIKDLKSKQGGHGAQRVVLAHLSADDLWILRQKRSATAPSMQIGWGRVMLCDALSVRGISLAEYRRRRLM
jgi:hypothetical protein